MQNSILLLVSAALLVSCGAYKLEKGQQGAKILIEAHNLRSVGNMRDDSATIELYENNNMLGYYMLTAQSKSELFDIPANKLTTIKTIQNVAKFGAVALCIVPVKISPKPNEQYKLTLSYSQWSSSCKAILYRHNGSGYVSLSELEAKDEGAVIRLRQPY